MRIATERTKNATQEDNNIYIRKIFRLGCYCESYRDISCRTENTKQNRTIAASMHCTRKKNDFPLSRFWNFSLALAFIFTLPPSPVLKHNLPPPNFTGS